MDKTMFRDALQWGVLSVLAIAQFPPASAEPVTLTTDIMDQVSAGTDASSHSSATVISTASGGSGKVSVTININGTVNEKVCIAPCAIITLPNGNLKVIPGASPISSIENTFASVVSMSAVY